MSTLFQPFPDDIDDKVLEDASLWRIDDMTKLDIYFGYEKSLETPQPEDETVVPYTKCRDLRNFKKLCLEEYELPLTKQSRKKDIAKYYFLLDQITEEDPFDWSNAKHFLRQLEDPNYKHNFDYTKCDDFKGFQKMAFVHYNMPATTQGTQASIATAYMAIDTGTNIRGIDFEKATPILNDLSSQKFIIFDTYTKDDLPR
jgi:hypothetical protein